MVALCGPQPWCRHRANYRPAALGEQLDPARKPRWRHVAPIARKPTTERVVAVAVGPWRLGSSGSGKTNNQSHIGKENAAAVGGRRCR